MGPCRPRATAPLSTAVPCWPADGEARARRDSATDDHRPSHGDPEGERTRAYARVLVNGRFNELLDGFAAELDDGDRVALTYPFMFCC